MRKPYIYSGCSTFNNNYWKGHFYPSDLPKSKWFEYYCKHFKTYELNVTFYRFPTVKSLQGWYHKSPEDFIFSVKAPKLITHLKQFIDCHQEAEEFYSTCHKGLGKKLGFILFQLPPSMAYSAHRLALILSYMNADFNNVIEFRNETWWRDEVYEALRENEVTFCNVSYPKLPTTLIQTTDKGYFRMHGVPQLFYSGYTDDELDQLHSAIHLASWKEAYIYFNNTASTAGILNAVEFSKLEGRPGLKRPI